MQPPNLCIHFQRGFCSYGNNCRFLHQQIGAYAQGGGRSYGSGARFTQTYGRSGRGGPGRGGNYSFYQESFFQISTTTRSAAPRPLPVRPWSTPADDARATQQGPSLNFRFMSWNVLAAELAHSHAGELYPQAHHSCLEWHRRLAAVVSHVAAQRPDVLCLQEVDDWPGLRKELGDLGYDGVHVQRTGGRGDGCATLWLRDRLRLAGPARAKSGATFGSGSGSGSVSGARYASVQKIRMADHDLKDNVALLVHLAPRRGASTAAPGSAGAGAGLSEREGAVRNGSDEDSAESGSRSNHNDGSGSSVDEGDVDVGSDGGVQPPSSEGRRPKRTRQHCEDSGSGSGAAAATLDDEAAAAAAATAGIASLRPYPPASATEGGGPAAGQPVGAPAAAGSSALPKHLRRGFWVANTHVLFNTKRGDIKLGQLRVTLSELAARASAATVKATAAEPAVAAATDASSASGAAATSAVSLPVIFAGDFNAAPGSGLYRFLRYGSLQLAEEDRRELSGQVEGYGYPQLQRDNQLGLPPRLARWGPGPELRNQATAATQVAPGAAAMAGAAAAAASVAAATTAAAAFAGTAASTSNSSTEEWRRLRQAQRDPWQQQQPFQPMARSYSVRWQEEELVHAMGRVAVANAVAAVQQAAAAAGGATTSQRASSAAGGGYGNGGWFHGSQGPYGAGGYNGGGYSGRGREEAGQWQAVTESAVVRHPLQLRSAYAALDEQEREPLFTTLHARYVGTVDFVWYTPGGGEGGGGFRLAPVRVLQPPDPLSYPYGMPCADWPSDHVSLVVDFRLS